MNQPQLLPIAGTPAASANDPRTAAFCHIQPPFQPQWKFSGAYNLPLALQVSGTYQSLPGIAVSANYAATNAEIRPSLGRDLSSGANGTVTINLIPPGTVFEDRIQQLDLRLTRTFRFGPRSLQAIVDLYNSLNGSAILSEVTPMVRACSRQLRFSPAGS